jgi:hypothetical protein
MQVGMKNYSEFLPIFLFNQTKPNTDNRSCRLGLRLALDSKQKTELIDIGRYSTTPAKYVNSFKDTNFKRIYRAERT